MRAISKHVATVWAIVLLAGGALPRLVSATAADQARMPRPIGDLPLSFEANEGQADRQVEFLCRGAGYTLFLTRGEAVLNLREEQRAPAVVRLRLAGRARHPRGVGLGRQVTTSNYLRGGDPRRWHTGVVNYSQVRYPAVYPGVDLVYHSSRRQLELDFVVAPGADPGRIRLGFQGTGAIEIGPGGELVAHTPQGDLVQHAPVIYQEEKENGRRDPVAGRYVLLAAPGPRRGGTGAREVGFAVGPYDRSRRLIIDPALVYSTFLGGAGPDSANTIAVDGAGNVYVAGATLSDDFPGVNGSSIQPLRSSTASAPFSRDVFVTKIDAAGTAIVYSTYLGGVGDDEAKGIAVDGAGNAYVTGTTGSAAFPGITFGSIQANLRGQSDAFVIKINAAGNGIVYSTFLGGDAGDGATSIALDAAGNAYVTGGTDSTTFPGANGSSVQLPSGAVQAAFVTKINAAGTAIVYSALLVADDHTSAIAIGSCIAVDGSGNAYVGGWAISSTFPGITPHSIQPNFAGSRDGFVAKLDATGAAIVYATFLGGSDQSLVFGIAVDGLGNAYVTGQTQSTSFPGVNGGSIQPAGGGGWDAFVTEIDAAGDAIVYSTFLGGSADDYGLGIAVDGTGNAYVTGTTLSTTFPGITASSMQPAAAGDYDAFVTRIGAAGTSIASTFLGSSNADWGSAIAVDGAGNIYVTGYTDSKTFPGVTASSFQPANAGGNDAFVAKIGCLAGGTTLCLGGGRFEVTASWATSTASGTARAVALTSDTGYLYFFDPSNVEAVVKVIDGCALNQDFWFFAGGLTNVETTIRVRDTRTGVVKTYHNPQGTPFQPIQDTGAFATCSAPQGGAAAPAPPGAAFARAPAGAANRSISGSALLLEQDRFEVDVTWQTAAGASGVGMPVALTDDTGYFWFFAASNVEMVIKVLNGCGLGGRYWVFAGGLTDVETTIKVTDTRTGASNTYVNPQGRAFRPIQDTNAFATCP